MQNGFEVDTLTNARRDIDFATWYATNEKRAQPLPNITRLTLLAQHFFLTKPSPNHHYLYTTAHSPSPSPSSFLCLIFVQLPHFWLFFYVSNLSISPFSSLKMRPFQRTLHSSILRKADTIGNTLLSRFPYENSTDNRFQSTHCLLTLWIFLFHFQRSYSILVKQPSFFHDQDEMESSITVSDASHL